MGKKQNKNKKTTTLKTKEKNNEKYNRGSNPGLQGRKLCQNQQSCKHNTCLIHTTPSYIAISGVHGPSLTNPHLLLVRRITYVSSKFIFY